MTVDRKDLAADYSRVTKTELDFKTTEYKILNFEATSQEIVDWYFAKDPLTETELLMSLEDQKLGSKKGTNYDLLSRRKHFLYKRAAVILLGQTVLPELFENPRQGYEDMFKYFYDLMLPPKNGQESPDPQVTGEDYQSTVLLDQVIDRLRNCIPVPFEVDMEKEELLKIFYTADMLRIASQSGDRRYWEKGSTYESRRFAGDESTDLYKEVAELALYKVPWKENKVRDRDVRILGIKALWQQMGAKMHHSQIPMYSEEKGRYKEIVEEPYLEMVNALKDVFLSDPNIKFTDGEMKGTLHELLWFLDFNVMLAQEEKKCNVFVYPSCLFQDSPKIGFPSNNRGFDYQVVDNGAGRAIFIQLKSKDPYFKKNYHPLVSVVTERDFPYSQRSRFEAKLNAYERLFTEKTEESWDLAKKFILPSVRETWGQLSSQDMSLAESLRSSYEQHQKIPHNNNARRRLMRDLNKRRINLDRK